MCADIKIRVGVEGGRKPVLARAAALGAPLLVSANSLWDNDRKRFGGWGAYSGFDVALDCGGFVAMKKYGGYRWAVSDYVALAGAMGPTWWAQMDFCCEPEIAGNRATVFRRIDSTADYLHECMAVAAGSGVAAPMPVLQGWLPSDYCQGPAYDPGFVWPSLVGIGSVCRRSIRGADGILAVVAALDRVVPAHVRFHLFGVKSGALAALMGSFPHRVASVDSMAWAKAAREEARKAKKLDPAVQCDGAMRARHMEAWYLAQQVQPEADNDQFTLL